MTKQKQMLMACSGFGGAKIISKTKVRPECKKCGKFPVCITTSFFYCDASAA